MCVIDGILVTLPDCFVPYCGNQFWAGLKTQRADIQVKFRNCGRNWMVIRIGNTSDNTVVALLSQSTLAVVSGEYRTLPLFVANGGMTALVLSTLT